MLFDSYIFILIFLPIVAAIFFLGSARFQRKLSIAWLVLASLFFYAWWNPIYLPLMIGSILFNFYVALALRKAKKHYAAHSLPLLIIGIVGNLLLLGYFKYFNFFIDNLNLVLNTDLYVAPIILPLAISFFTFTQITYLVDAYSYDTEDYDLVHYMLFVTFFPHLLAGPIIHHAEIMPQFDRDETYRLNRRNIQLGLSIFAIGLFKKTILADNIFAFSNPFFLAADAGNSLSTYEAWEGAIAFSLRVYFDFSAYTDMAIGSARLFGIKLPINFYSPFKSLNTAEFWRRWHMSLTRLITEYIYSPISISMARKAIAANSGAQVVFWKSIAYPLVVTFVIVGVWHGAGWNFAIYGALQGVMIIVNNLWRQFRKNVLKHDLQHTTLAGRILSRGLTSACFIFTLVFFRAGTTDGALTMAATMLGLNENGLTTGPFFSGNFLLFAVLYFAIIFFLPNTQQFFAEHEPSLEPKRKEKLWGLEKMAWAPTRPWAIICSVLFALGLLNLGTEIEFVYLQF